MPLPHLVKMTMFFKTIETGWTESHILMTAPSGSPRPIYGAIDPATTLAVFRAQMLGWGPLLYRVKLSWLDVWRDSVYATPPRVAIGTGSPVPVGVPYYNSTAGNTQTGDPWDVASFRIEETENYRGEEPISGYPDGMLSQNTVFPFAAPFSFMATPTTTYFNALTGQTQYNVPSAGGLWGSLVRAKDADGPAPVVVSSIAYTAGPPFGWTYTCAAAHGLVAGDSVRVLGVQQPPGQIKTKFNGTWNVLSVAGLTFTVAYDLAGPSYVAICQDATSQKIQLIAKAYTNWTFDGTTHRKRGVPSDRPHGRRKRSVPTGVV
jgi:hypothetical protein